ncbi:MAG: HlyD family efflux transporter periplasmic adaptor subunit [Oscillospiraceae bacterium]|nr:HlyD family efflux transporter periplasmic adaptor subunit [Oscillospiraceae bacterium]
MKNMIFKIVIIAVILAAGWVAVFNIPDAVESFLPVVKTVTMARTEYNQTASGAGLISLNPKDGAWLVTIAVGESDIRRVEPGQPADIKGAAFDDGVYTATVLQIGEIATNQSGEFIQETVVEVILKIDNPDDALKQGYTARADIKTDEMQTINIIPYSAILQDDTGEFVYVLSGNTATRRDILTGIELADGAQVVSGLFDNDRIIVSPGSVNDNALVRNEAIT